MQLPSLVKDLSLFRQPIVNLSRKVLGYEILLRVKDVDNTYLSPVNFIERQETSGRITSVDVYIASLAMKAIAESSGQDLFYNINVSAITVENENAVLALVEFYERYKAALQSSNISLTFEVTETARVTNVDAFVKNIQKIQGAGIRIALDDFGSGFNSLLLLGLLRPDCIKLSKEFMEYSGHAGVLYLMELMVSKLSPDGVKIVAEGVETENMFQQATNLKVDMCQGYFFGKPEGFYEL